MIILIPIGGIGKRFKDNNYKLPKALINIFGKPILYYLLDNLILSSEHIIYIVYNKEYKKYRFEDLLKKHYPNLNFIFHMLQNNTSGAAETINIGLNNLTLNDQPILCLDSDNFYTLDIIKLWNKKNCIFTIYDTTEIPIYSYVKHCNNKVIDIVEKQKISNYVCSGAYGFSSYKQLQKYTQYILDNKIKQKNEFYTSTVIKEMLKQNHFFHNINIDKKYWNCLGTPIQTKIFYNNYPVVSSFNNKKIIESKRFCFDLDNTLVTYPKIQNDYTTVEPITKNIELLRYLKNMGNTIIIYTARRMKTHSGNVGKIICDVGQITLNTLNKFKIPYDEIYFGKPYAHYYIDDLAVNCNDNMEKYLGYYMDKIEPRTFNNIQSNLIEIYKKSSNDLSGEIFYYKNIPKKIKDMFPILIDYDISNKWYKIEKISGITISELYTSELLTTDMLQHIINSIQRIHDTKDIHSNNINIYENYSKKMEKRYLSYNYKKYKNYKETYQNIYNKLIEYETKKMGKKTIIHGDTVFTNIILNNNGKLKFIDMRGKIGEIFTIYGDHMYDWAKLYQSLIGYDNILLNKTINDNYQKTIINYFKKKFVEMFSEEKFEYLKWITKSLLFTLIPLHNNEKCQKYYDLINLNF
jgi:capsule biosynthesis phosphatase